MAKTVTLPNGLTVEGVPDDMTTGGLIDRMMQKGTLSPVEGAQLLGQQQEQLTSGAGEDFLVGAGEFFADRSFGLVDNSIRAPDTLAAGLGRAAPGILAAFAAPGAGLAGIGSQAGISAGLESIRQGASVGSTLGAGALGGVGTAGGNLASRVFRNIRGTAGQVSQTLGRRLDSDFLRRIESGISAAGGFDFLRRSAQSATNRSAAKSIGVTADKLEPAVLLKAARKIGAEFDRLMPDDTAFDLAATKAQLDDLPITGQLKQLAAQVDNNGLASGNTVKNLRTTLQKKVSALRGQNDDLADELHEAAELMMQELDDQIVDPAAFRVAREQWKNLRLLEGLPEVRAAGNVTSRQAMAAFARDRGYGTSFTRDTGTVLPETQGMFNQVRELELLREIVGDSGTATRLAALTGIGAGVGFVVEGDIEGAGRGAAIALAPLALGRLSVGAAGTLAAGARAGQVGAALTAPARD